MEGILGAMLEMRSRLGIGAMLDERRLSSWMADALRNAQPGERQIILRILAEGLPGRMLAGEVFSEDQVRFQAGHISRTWFLREDMVLAALRCWQDALAGAGEDGEDGAGAAPSASVGRESDSGAPVAPAAGAASAGGAGDGVEIADFPGFAGFAVTVRGHSHEKDGRPCQDFSKFHIRQDCAFVAASDGHGEDRCFRSRQGAQCGVFCALRSLNDFMDQPEYRERLRTAGEKERTDILQHIAEWIILRWRETTERHFERFPLKPEELDLCRRMGIVGEDGTAPWQPSHYGATLLYACMAPDFAFASQIGDGTCLFLFGDNGEDCPIPGVGAGRPALLCDDGAERSFRHHFVPHREEWPVNGIFLATDGLADSYTEDGLRRFGRTLLGHLERDRPRARAAVRELRDSWLPTASRCGGGDVTIAGVFRKKWATKA